MERSGTLPNTLCRSSGFPWGWLKESKCCIASSRSILFPVFSCSLAATLVRDCLVCFETLIVTDTFDTQYTQCPKCLKVFLVSILGTKMSSFPALNKNFMKIPVAYGHLAQSFLISCCSSTELLCLTFFKRPVFSSTNWFKITINRNTCRNYLRYSIANP